MNPPSRRYSTSMITLIALALIPVTLHVYLGFETDDCAGPDSAHPAIGSPDS